VWAALPVAWTEHDQLDEEAIAANVNALCAAEVAGVYTTGSTGEFYALDESEFQRLVDLTVAGAGPYGTPTMVCCADTYTRGTLRKLEYAAEAGVQAAQVALPFWMELSDEEVLDFFLDLAAAAPGLPLMHYNIPRAKRFLGAEQYLRIVERVPQLIGCKFTFIGQHFGELLEALARVPEIAFFVGEPYLATGVQRGARGCCSSFVLLNPARMLAYWEACDQGRWDEAFAVEESIHRMHRDLFAWVQEQGLTGVDPVFDKGMARAAGFLQGHQRVRKPYRSWTNAEVESVRGWLEDNYPEWIYAGE
jgi:dihydrodipicolinate synthase/N-acetylneuraminate lyase